MAADSKPQFSTPPPPTKVAVLSFPSPQILLVTLNRPKQLNCINLDGHEELHRAWAWMDEEPSIRVGVITGMGRAFCAGADLKGIPKYLSSIHMLNCTTIKHPQASADISQNGTPKAHPSPAPCPPPASAPSRDAPASSP